MKQIFKPGDQVSLISGGPTMTIGKFINDDTEAQCFYFPCHTTMSDASHKPNWGMLATCSFPIEALRLV